MEDAFIRQPLIGIVPWWTVLLEGIAALIIGLLFLAAPVFTLLAAVSFLGAYWFVIGVLAIISMFVDRSNLGLKLIVGILGIIAGIAVLEYPAISAIVVPATLILYIAILGVFLGLVSLYRAASSRAWGHAVTGIISILFGLLIIANPLAAVMALPYVLGIIGVIGGIITIAGALSLRSAHRHFEAVPAGRVTSSMGAGLEPGETTTRSGEEEPKV
ncbi:MAG TPA: HdeD family acid-resistance protein [Methanotrichaceae archaeon]|nr:HdeD family acid-resistance protein [Methanotrichaceae archaeon]